MSSRRELIIASYEALSRGELDAWLGPVGTDAELYELPELPDTGVHRGHEALKAWATAAMGVWEDWQWTPEEFIGETDRTVLIRVRLSGRGLGSDVPIEQTLFHIIRFNGEKMVEFRGFLDEQQARESADLPAS
jgi:ketosteroid isomerase-like protein